MKAALSTLALMAAVAYAQDRCDAPYPKTFCNTTEILAFQSSDCKAYHVFLARGSDEPYPGRQGNITREICSRLGSNDCGFENIEYPAKSTAWGKDEWCKSAAKGAASGQSQMKAYAQKCPSSKLILLGFSQGAAVAQDILGGGGGQVFECEQASNPALDASSAPGSNIIAAVTFGAVIRSRNQNFTIGDGVNFDGRRARTETQLAALNKYSNRLRDYCHYGDPMCAVGSTPENVYVHLNYFLEHNEEVVAWINEKAQGDTGKVSDNSKSSESSPSPSPSLQASTPAQTSNSPITKASPSVLLSISSVSAQTNTPPQSSSPPTSAIAKSAAAPSATPISIVSNSASRTDSSEAQPVQTNNGNANTTTGAASTLTVDVGIAVLSTLLGVALCFAL